MMRFVCRIALLLVLTLQSQTNGQCIETLSGSTSIDDFTVQITMDCINEKITLDIEYNNYNNDWFGIVFHHHMIEHPSLVYTTGKNADRTAALYYYDLVLKSSDGVMYNPNKDWTQIETSNENGIIRLIYEQYLSQTEWDTSITSIGFRFAVGSSLQLAMHVHKSAHAVVTLSSSNINSDASNAPSSIPTSPVTTTSQPTFSTTTDTPIETDPQCAGNDDWTASAIFDDFYIILTINCITETIEINMTYHNFDHNWFGIVFNDEMSGDSIIYTTGKSDHMPAALYFYSISGKNPSSVVYDEGLNWHEIHTNVNGTSVQLIYSQHLSKTAWNINTNEISMRWAVGDTDTLQLAHHKSRSSTTKYYNFISGGSRNEADDLSMQITHAVIMWICWCVFATIGIMCSAFRWILPIKPKGCWFKIHRAIQSAVIILHMIGFIIAIIFVQQSAVQHFSNVHMIIGLVVTILVLLQPLNAFFRPHPVKINEKKPMKRLIWEIMHKLLGYMTWILACVAAYLGFKLPIINEPLLAYIHLFGVCLLIFMVYIILTMIGCSANKKQTHVITVNNNAYDSSESDQLVTRHT